MSGDLSSIRSRIATDHAVLRGLMRALVAGIRAAERDSSLWTCVHDVLGQLDEELKRHFSYEETMLFPTMLAMGAWGSARVDQQVVEHAEQRQALMALAVEVGAREARSGNLTAEAVWLFHCLEKDMAEEEARLRMVESDRGLRSEHAES